MELSADLILANRAYMDHQTPPGTESRSSPGNGGLLAAVRPVIAPWEDGRGTTWIGAGSGAFDREWTDERGFELIPTGRGALRHRRLYFDAATWRSHYASVANMFFWPLLHLVRDPLPELTSYFPRPAVPSERDWNAYANVNDAFAQAAMDEQESSARTCWVHDYQLALVPAKLRERKFRRRIGFFLHTPFPDVAMAQRYLDEHGRDFLRQFVAGMLGADLVGLQSPADVERFTRAAEELCGTTPTATGVMDGERNVSVGAYPAGIDSDEVIATARAAAASTRLGPIPEGVPLVVGLERSDYTKGIPERLAALTAAYRAGLRFAYCGIAAPTREGVSAYDEVDAVIAGRAAEARSAADAAGLPFLHTREAIDWSEVVALQRDANIVFTSSLADGMNLVPLQAAVAQSLREPGQRATLLTGRDAGVASAFAGFEGDGLIPVNPLNPQEMLETFEYALRASAPRVTERLVAAVREHGAEAWARSFLTDLENAC